jgi:zinc/manganese transport system substrate-binding protein
MPAERMTRRALLAAAAAAALTPAAAANPRRIVASFPVLADFAAAAAGPAYEVVSLASPQADPHHLEPAPSHARALAGAHVLIANGLGYDPWAGRIAAAADFAGPQIAVGEGLAGVIVGPGGERDPHVWQDPDNATAIVARIAQTLGDLDPAGAEGYTVRARIFAGRMRALKRELAHLLAPAAGQPLVVAHDSFAYFARAFGLVFWAASPGVSHAAPSASEIAALIAKMRAARPGALFLEVGGDDRLIRRIAAETGLPVAGRLYVERAPAIPVSAGGEGPYIAMMRANARTIRAALA